MRKYTFQMTKEEVRELWSRVIWEQLRVRRFRWLLFLVILAVECILLSWPGALTVVALLLGIYMAFIVRGYFTIKGQLCEKTRTMWIEDGMLKGNVEGEMYNEISCSYITEIRMTRHVLMLGFCEAAKTIRWYSIPLRVFADERERDRFIELIKDPQTAGERADSPEESREASCGEEQEYLSLSFQVGDEEWVRMMADATEIIQAGTLNERKKNILPWIILTAVFIMLPCWAVWRYPDAGKVTHIALLMGMLIFLMLLRKRSVNPEKEIRKRVRRGTNRYRAEDIWETSVTETGIRQGISGKSSATVPWDGLFGMVETEMGLFFYQKDKKSFLFLPKWSMESSEQIESLRGLCREKHLEILAGKRKKYVPNWVFTILFFFVALGYIAANAGLAIWDSRRGMDPGHLPFEEQISVLRSFGFDISADMEENWYGHMEEYDIVTYVEEYPYTWLLSNLAWEESAGVFWFDFEGWDICTDYITVLEGMRELAAGSILDDVKDIREDTEDMDWENGTGTITVSLEWSGQEYSWKMDVEHDWIDGKVLGIYNGLLEGERDSERFYATGDGGQGALVFYCTGEWASAFEDATGLELEAYTVKGE